MNHLDNLLQGIREAAGMELDEGRKKRRFGDLHRDASNVAALQTKLAQLKSKTGVNTLSKAFKAGAATARVDMRRGGAKLAVQVPQKSDNKDWREGYLSALPLEVAVQARRRLGEGIELEESKGADFGEKLKEKLKGTGSWKYQDTAGPMSYALKCDDVGNKGEEVRRKLKRFLLGQGFKLAKTTGKPDDFEWGKPYRQIYKRDRDEVSIESSTPFKGIRIIYSRNIQLRGPEGPSAHKPARREFTGQGALFGESRPLVDPDVAFAMALAKAIKRYGRFKVEPGKGGQGMVLSKDDVGRPHECRKAIIEWLQRKGFTEAGFKPGGWEHRNRWIYRKGNAQVEIAHQAIYDSMTVTISPGAGGSEKRRPDPIQTGMFGEAKATVADRLEAELASIKAEYRTIARMAGELSRDERKLKGKLEQTIRSMEAHLKKLRAQESTDTLGGLLEAVKLHLPSGAAHQIKANPLEYIARAAMDAQVDLRGADSLADLLGRMDPPPPRAAMIDARDAAELVGKARAGAWRAKGLLKDLVRKLQSRPSAAAMALEDSE